MSSPKQIVYRYNGIAATDETEVDLHGEQPVPEKDRVLERAGRDWKIVTVMLEQSVSDPKALPVYRVFLTDQF
jgi:hypothetical protein